VLLNRIKAYKNPGQKRKSAFGFKILMKKIRQTKSIRPVSSVCEQHKEI
jgi:hypothetical protein